MNDTITELKTDEALLHKLREVTKPTREEVKEQRVSFAYGSLDSSSTMTKDQVRRLVELAD